jgi:hypothetical protein
MGTGPWPERGARTASLGVTNGPRAMGSEADQRSLTGATARQARRQLTSPALVIASPIFQTGAAARYDPAMAAQSPIRRVVTVARLWQPQIYWQVWFSAARWPLVALIAGVGIRLFSGRWPQFDIFGAIATVGYVTVGGSAGRRALRARCRILGLAAASDRGPKP